MKIGKLLLLACIIGLFLSGCDRGIVDSAQRRVNDLSARTNGLAASISKSTWDWTNGSSYHDYYGNPIPPPWPEGMHMGVDVTQTNKCDPSDGWELLFKRMEADDYISNNSIKAQSTGPKNPYFVLYN